jgi:hypothetical protein
LARSPIAASGAVTAGTGAVTALLGTETPAPATPNVIGKVEQVGQQASQVKTAAQHVRELAVDTLGIPPGAVLPVVLVAAGACVMWWRAKQRRDGWA